MASILQRQFQPETNPELLSSFGIVAPLEVRRILDELVHQHTPVRLYAGDDQGAVVASEILARDESALRLDFTSDAQTSRTFQDCRRLTVVTLLDHVKIQFDSSPLRMLADGGLPTLVCSLPVRVARFQRRDAFRVRPPIVAPVECVIRTMGSDERAYPVQDISPAGLAIILPAGDEIPASGEVWRHCRLEIPGYPPIPCDLQVRAVGDVARDSTGTLRVGLEFYRPVLESARAVQVYVMDVQTGRYRPSRG